MHVGELFGCHDDELIKTFWDSLQFWALKSNLSSLSHIVLLSLCFCIGLSNKARLIPYYNPGLPVIRAYYSTANRCIVPIICFLVLILWTEWKGNRRWKKKNGGNSLLAHLLYKAVCVESVLLFSLSLLGFCSEFVALVAACSTLLGLSLLSTTG